MALPIKETPVLKGRDAEKFIERMENAEAGAVSEEEYRRAKEVYIKVQEAQTIS